MKTNKEIVTEIIEDLEKTVGLNWPGNKRVKITREKLIECWSEYREEPDWKFYGYTSANPVSSNYKKIFSATTKEHSSEIWKNYILRIKEYKYCSNCTSILNLNSFHKDKGRISGQSLCKVCFKENTIIERVNAYQKEYRNKNREWILEKHKKIRQTDRYKKLARARENKRRASKLQRTPMWVNYEKIKEFYLNCPDGYHVDHEIPLQGKLVSGLHILENLQYLTAKENLSKSNKYEVE